jgi:hypothetical protein
MKRFFSLLLLCCILGQASIRTVWTLHYQINRAIYLKNCENKDRPNLHCDGKCYLKKKMGVEQTDASKEPKLPESFQQIKDLQLFCEVFVAMPVIAGVVLEQQLPMPAYQFSFPVAGLTGIFRPPATSDLG